MSVEPNSNNAEKVPEKFDYVLPYVEKFVVHLLDRV